MFRTISINDQAATFQKIADLYASMGETELAQEARKEADLLNSIPF